MIPYRSIHFVGILSPEMASLACFTALQGVHVTGSDDHEESIFTEPLKKAGIKLYDMFAQTNISNSTDLLVVSPYYDFKHPEVVTAQLKQVRAMTATDYTKELTKTYRKLVSLDEYEGRFIAAALAHILNEGNQPLNAFTGMVDANSANATLAKSEDSEWFAIALSGFKRDMTTYEANFLSHEAEVVIIPSVRYNYPELNTTLDDVYQSYYRFVKSIPRKGLIIGNSDWSRMKRLRTHLVDRHMETYGFDNDAAWRIRDVFVEDGRTSFRLTKFNQSHGPFTIPISGEAMVYCAAAIVVMCLLLEVKHEVIERGLATLPNYKRFFEIGHDAQGRLLIDDCADHPDTIRSVLENVRAVYPGKKIWCLYQAGSYLKTKALAKELEEALAVADTIYLADIKGYPKEKSEGLHIRHLIAQMKQKHSQVFYIDPSVNMVQLLKDRVALGDCIVTLGVEGVCQEIVAGLHEKAEDGKKQHGSVS